MNRTPKLIAAGALALAVTIPAAFAQSSDSKPSDSKPAERVPSSPRPPASDFVHKTYFLSNVSEQNDANEILIALRNMLEPGAKLLLIASQNAIELSAPPDQQALAQRILTELDRPRKVYRLTFTLADSDSGKRIGVQHFTMIIVAGQRTVLKQGDKIPVATGTYDAKNDTGTQTQFQYLDIGLSFDATLTYSPDGLLLKSKVEESSLGQPALIAGVQEPVIRQTVLEGTSAMKSGKPLTLGSLDIVGTTRHMDIEVVAEPVS